MIPPEPAEARPLLGHRHRFPLGSPAFPLFLFYETTTAAKRDVSTMNPALQFIVCVWPITAEVLLYSTVHADQQRRLHPEFRKLFSRPVAIKV